jgi:hypothetical protein
MTSHALPSAVDDAGDDPTLCAELLSVVDVLSRRRADLLDDRQVAAYVRKGWLEWAGGTLRPTPIGARVCDAVLLAYA